MIPATFSPVAEELATMALAAAERCETDAAETLRARAAARWPTDPWDRLFHAREILRGQAGPSPELVVLVAVGLLDLALRRQGEEDHEAAAAESRGRGMHGRRIDDRPAADPDLDADGLWGQRLALSWGRRQYRSIARGVGIGVDAVRRLETLAEEPQDPTDRAVAAAVLRWCECSPADFGLTEFPDLAPLDLVDEMTE